MCTTGTLVKVAASTAAALLVFVLLTTTFSSANAQVLAGYVLGPGDVLEIAVFGEPDLSRTVTVRADGRITIPLLGDFIVAGLTTGQLSEAVAVGLRLYLKNPVVTVTVTTARPTFVYLVGAGVSRPGAYQMQAGWRVLDVITTAGGLTPRAAARKAVLVRSTLPAPIPLNLEQLFQGDERSANPSIEPGDVILVPTIELRVFVMGLVRTPGVFDFDEGARVLDAVMRAGGPADRASLNEVGVIRPAADGQLRVTRVNLNKVIREGDRANNPLIQHGDIVFVPESRQVDWRSILDWVLRLRLILGPQFFFLGP